VFGFYLALNSSNFPYGRSASREALRKGFTFELGKFKVGRNAAPRLLLNNSHESFPFTSLDSGRIDCADFLGEELKLYFWGGKTGRNSLMDNLEAFVSK
jgi:hypothetical protein